jgi:hypothetical protein
MNVALTSCGHGKGERERSIVWEQGEHSLYLSVVLGLLVHPDARQTTISTTQPSVPMMHHHHPPPPPLINQYGRRSHNIH